VNSFAQRSTRIEVADGEHLGPLGLRSHDRLAQSDGGTGRRRGLEQVHRGPRVLDVGEGKAHARVGTAALDALEQRHDHAPSRAQRLVTNVLEPGAQVEVRGSIEIGRIGLVADDFLHGRGLRVTRGAMVQRRRSRGCRELLR
jgi:hypothetical protein